MKFSEALRLADTLELPDLRESYIKVDPAMWGGEKPPCCAISGANVAAGRVPMEFEEVGEDYAVRLTLDAQEKAQNYWGPITRYLFCPADDNRCGDFNEAAGDMIINLYDYHFWSRTKIADWLDEVAPE